MSLRINIHLANKNAAKALVSQIHRSIMQAVFTRRVVVMKRSRTEVGRWRMLRQVSRRKARWLEGQSRRNMRILAIRKELVKRQRHSLLFTFSEF
ncbi:hypothetical protein CF026_00495 [Klebsiella michiganensis]|nr:hypothetical protein BWI76_17200 [Klebsiella sp. M5al]AWT17689.1 hypothetical protein DMP75_03520 [Klebsiella michiganensis]EBX6544739.1 hypothetical protein [Salmonella enterica subsp. enterica serovar Larochelle]MBW6008564.1 hypothetical protein [Klebsiella sp. CVUAS 11263]MBW6031030.1 hypothetical protein [Klebsiella sp. CVUAS 11332]MBX4671283.1 hypothetical protein [Klebsiella sp. CVUAS 5466.2]MBX4753601.1 hypothetical protein [Klebsiella sp. CVUAS 8534.2]MBX4775971.1 hypothetical pro